MDMVEVVQPPKLTEQELSKRHIRLRYINVAMTCLVCGHVWGFKVNTIEEINNIPEDKRGYFTCLKCLNTNT